jgi:cell division protein FtsA
VANGGLIAALDVGSSKICCFIAEKHPNGVPRVAGIGQQASKGVKNGAIVGMDQAEEAIRNAVHAAEQMAGETIEQVIVNLSGGYPVSNSIGVEVAIDGHEVAESDLRRVFQQSRQAESLRRQNQSGRQLIHVIPTGYTIDGSRGIRDPLGMYGDLLGVNFHVVTASAGAVRNLSTCIERCHLDPVGFVVSPYASGLAVLVDDEMDLGVTVIELSAPLAHAERLKTLYGHAMTSPVDEREMIDVPQVGEAPDEPAHQVPRSILTAILQPRLEETMELVRSRLETSGFDKIAGRRVVLTGGACQVPGLSDLAALVLDKQVRIGKPVRACGLAEATAGPAYSTCAGLLGYALKGGAAQPRDEPADEHSSAGLIGRLGSWLRQHF